MRASACVSVLPQVLAETATCHMDLAILPSPTWVLAFVVAAEQQDEPIAGRMAEHPGERRLAVQAVVAVPFSFAGTLDGQTTGR